MLIPEGHPRRDSLLKREKLIRGFEEGYVAIAGLIAHGRGEAFDYLLGEETVEEALEAERAAAATLLLAIHPVLSVNGNVAALAAEEVVELAEAVNAGIEVNLFHHSEERVKKIEEVLLAAGAKRVLGTGRRVRLPGISSARAYADPEGIARADVVLVALEDGDRTEALVAAGKKVIAIDLNPMSRTARAATITIVDEVTRALPRIRGFAAELGKLTREELEKVLEGYDNQRVLARVERRIRLGLSRH